MDRELNDSGIGMIHVSRSSTRQVLVQVVTPLQLKVAERHEGLPTHWYVQDRTGALQVGDPAAHDECVE